MEPRGENQSPLLLLVEDDTHAVELFEHVFRKLNTRWHMVRVADGLEAVKFIMSHPTPDLIVTDLDMPRMNGQQLLAWVRANDRKSHVPVLVLSCCSEPGLDNKLRVLGANEYICKFSPINELKSALRRYVFDPSTMDNFTAQPTQ